MTTLRSALAGITVSTIGVLAVSSIGSASRVAAQQTSCPQLATEVARLCSALQTDAERYVRGKGVQFAYRQDPVQTLIEDAYRNKVLPHTDDLKRDDLIRINEFIKEQEARAQRPHVTYI